MMFNTIFIVTALLYFVLNHFRTEMYVLHHIYVTMLVSLCPEYLHFGDGQYAGSLDEALNNIEHSNRTCNLIIGVGDGKAGAVSGALGSDKHKNKPHLQKRTFM